MKNFKKLFIPLIVCAAALGTSAGAENLTISDSGSLVSFLSRINAGETFSGNTVTLGADIDMNGISWTPGGTLKNPFMGTFDGNNHTISNVTSSFSADKVYVGIIGYNKGTVKNLTVEAAVPSGEGWDIGIDHWTDASRNFGGIIVGYNEGNIDSCKAQGVINTNNLLSFGANGGICGYNQGTISNCINEADVNAKNTTNWDLVPTLADAYAGGICGVNEGTVTMCTSASSAYIKAESRFGSTASGLIVGDNRKGAIVSGCTAGGDVLAWTQFAMNMGYGYAGGIVGSNGGQVTDSVANGATVRGVIQGGDADKRFNYADVGGIVGYNYGKIFDCETQNTKIMAGAHAQVQKSYMAYAGGICGYNMGEISKVKSATKYETLSFEGRTLSPDYLGGIAGYNKDGIITRATSQTTTTTYTSLNDRKRYFGGVVGVNDEGYVSLSGSSTSLSGDNLGGITTGGVAGKNTGMVENCYHTGALIKGYTAGGIVGENTGSILDCYTKTIISTSTNKDGITYKNAGYVEGCFTAADTACEGGKKATQAELKNSQTYKDWEFDAFWTISGSYPAIKDEIGELEFFGEGSGTQASPYMITTERELSMVRYQPDKHYRLMSDITLSGNWSPIGNCRANAFRGVFDGNGHTIKNLVINGNANMYNGLFGYCEGAKICNLTVENAKVTVNNFGGRGVYAGGICGFARDAVIENCEFDGEISASAMTVCAGGIAGDLEGTLRGCRTNGKVAVNASGSFANSLAGGICAKAEGSISGCNSAMLIMATEADNSGYPMEATGGIAGRMVGDISDCSFKGSVDVTDKKTVYHGGIAGSIEGNITNSYTDYEMGYNDSMNGALTGQIMQGGVSAYYNNSTSYDSLGTGRSSFTDNAIVTLLGANQTEDKYIWVKSDADSKPEPLYVKASWELGADGFTRCVLDANAENAKIYYTTDSSVPTEESALYEAPFTADIMDQVSFVVKSGMKTSKPMGFVSSPKGDYLVQIVASPVNQNGEAITPVNIADSTKATIELITSEEKTDARIFFVVLDEKDGILYANTKVASLVKGKNTVTFDNINAPKGDKVQIFVWDSEMKLIPYSGVIRLQEVQK